MIPVGIALDTAIAFLKRYKALIAIIPLCLALAWQTYQVSRWKGKEADARATIAQMQVASEQARAKQIALNQAMQDKYETLAEKADHAHSIELADARSRAAAYAGRNGLRAYCQGSAGQTSSAPEGPVAPDRNGPGEGADMVVLSRNDFDLFVANSVRLQAIHEWGQSLITDGVAVVYPEPNLSATAPNQ